ncbi:hypothetical protein FOA52_002059 [Chlamydomonas sp. UWO 241]|nr:hypothetical protein FOA52_002059 [Chlamydomonas sp. UWO 241]
MSVPGPHHRRAASPLASCLPAPPKLEVAVEPELKQKQKQKWRAKGLRPSGAPLRPVLAKSVELRQKTVNVLQL